MLKTLAFLFIVVFACSLPGSAPAKDGSDGGADKLIVVGNNEYMSLQDFNAIVSSIEEQQRYKLSRDEKIQLLRKFANEELMYADAVKNGLDKDPLLQKKLESLKKRFFMEEHLGEYIRKNVNVSEQEALEYFNKNKEDYLRPALHNGFFYTIQSTVKSNEKGRNEIAEKIKNLIVKNDYAPIDSLEMHNFNQNNPDYNVVLYKTDGYYKGKRISIPAEAAETLLKLSPKSLTVTKSGNDTIISVLTNRFKEDDMPFEHFKSRIMAELYEVKAAKAHKELLESLRKTYELKIRDNLIK